MLFLLPGDVWAKPQIDAQAAILMDAKSGQAYFAKNAGLRMAPASLTKIMTCLVALDQGVPLDGVVTVEKRAAQVYEGQIVDLETGDRLTLRDLLRAALIYSANDSTVAIAQHVAGSHDLFIALMNLKALVLGATGTRFANTNGYTDPNHYTCARDLGVITRYALKKPFFAQTVKTPFASIHWIGKNRRVEIHNTNRLLGSYPGLDGVKTGTTQTAGKCLITTAQRNGRRLITVVLKSGDRYLDSIKLLDYGFNNVIDIPACKKDELMAYLPVAGGQCPGVVVLAQSGVVLSVSKEEKEHIQKKILLPSSVQAPVQKGTVLGEAVYSLHGEELGRVALVAGERVAPRSLWQRWFGSGKAK